MGWRSSQDLVIHTPREVEARDKVSPPESSVPHFLSHRSPVSTEAMTALRAMAASSLEPSKEERRNSLTTNPVTTALSVTLLPPGQALRQRPWHLRLRDHLQWWNRFAPQHLVAIVAKGLQPTWIQPPQLAVKPCHPSDKQVTQARALIEEYIEAGILTKLGELSCIPQDTKFLIPWFVLEKTEGKGTKV